MDKIYLTHAESDRLKKLCEISDRRQKYSFFEILSPFIFSLVLLAVGCNVTDITDMITYFSWVAEVLLGFVWTIHKLTEYVKEATVASKCVTNYEEWLLAKYRRIQWRGY
jgi:hypothetical protein